MATLHKFVQGTPTSLTTSSLNNTVVNKPSYWIPNPGYSGYTLQYVDVSSVKNKGIEIVLASSTTKFLSHDNFNSNTVHCQEITPPSPTIVDGKYHYIFGPNTFQYNKVVAVGNLIKNSGSNHYYSTLNITSATAGVPYWEDVDIPEFISSAALTPKTVEGYGGTTYQSTYIIYYPPTSKSKSMMTGYNNSNGKIRYFELPPGDGKFETNGVYYAFISNVIAYNQKIEQISPTSISGSKRTWDAGPSDTTRYILITASVPSTAGNIATNATSGDASIPNIWGTGTIHSRVSGSWT